MVHLNGLARGDMGALWGGIFFGDLSQSIQLIRIQVSPFNFDANHVLIGGIADAINAIFQPEAAKIVRIQGATFKLADIVLKKLEFRFLDGRKRVL